MERKRRQTVSPMKKRNVKERSKVPRAREVVTPTKKGNYEKNLDSPLNVILSQDHNQIVALLEYVRYDFQPQIQLCSIKILSILSSRMLGLSQLLLKSNTANALIEDYAACLELRSEESQIIEDSSVDPGVLIMQLLINNIGRPSPNVTHLLLKFDVDSSVRRTLLQPKFHYSCLKVILDILDKLSKPDINALLHEFGFQLLYYLCVDPLTSGPTMDLLSTRKYQFFVKHLKSVGVAPFQRGIPARHFVSAPFIRLLLLINQYIYRGFHFCIFYNL